MNALARAIFVSLTDLKLKKWTASAGSSDLTYQTSLTYQTYLPYLAPVLLGCLPQCLLRPAGASCEGGSGG